MGGGAGALAVGTAPRAAGGAAARPRAPIPPPHGWQNVAKTVARCRGGRRRPPLPRSQEEEFCDEFHLVDLRVYDNCKRVVAGCDQVFNLAADLGGMG